MGKKEPIKVSLPVFITLIVLLVAIVCGFYMYMQNEKLKEEIATVSNKMSQTQSENSELKEKLNSVSNIAPSTNEENKTEEEKITENQYSIYTENFKKDYKNIIAKYEGQPGIEGDIVVDQFESIPLHGIVKVKSNGDAYYSKDDEEKKIDTNVASAHYCSVGQDSGDVVLIHRDGTVSVIKDVLYPDKKMEPTKIEKAKNIVKVLKTIDYDDMDGGYTYYLVDINGNIISAR